MIIYIGADHRGFDLKESLKKYLNEAGYEVADLGATTKDENDDYIDYAVKVASWVSKDPSTTKGILLCKSGVGMDIVVNKFRNVRGSLCFSSDQAIMAKNDDDANILILPAGFLDEEKAKQITSIWLTTKFDGKENHSRRIKKIEELEQKITNYLE